MTKNVSIRQQPPIPNKRYFTIGEVSEICDVQPHVLRYWEQEFEQLDPIRRRSQRRYYTRQDVLLVRKIIHLLYIKKFTIEGARGLLAEGGRELETQDDQLAFEAVEEAVSDLKKVVELLEND